MKESSPKNIKEIFKQLNITDYVSCQDYLASLYKLFRDNIINYNHEEFSSFLGFAKTDNTIRLIISGKRKLSVKKAKVICQNLQLPAREKKYWDTMALLANAKNAAEQDTHLSELIRLKAAYSSKKNSSQKKIMYFDEWYHSVIREMIGLSDSPQSAEEIQKRLMFPLNLSKIKKSLELLKEIGLIKYDQESGTYSRTHEKVTTDWEIDDIEASKYHQKMIAMGAESIFRVSEKLRSVSSVTVNLSEEQISLVKAKIQLFLDEILLLEEAAKKDDRVYQLNVQLFPFSKRDE